MYSTNAPPDRLLRFDRPEDRGRLQEAEALAVVFPQARFLTPSAVSADPVDPPFIQVFENLEYTLCVTVPSHSSLSRTACKGFRRGLRGDPLRQTSSFSTKFWSCCS